MPSIIDSIVKTLFDTGLAKPGGVVGCTPDEIHRLEQKFGVTLPAVYREFLEKMGKNAGMLFRGTNVFYNRLFELRTDSEELLAENQESFHLSEDAFVFLMHQGYEFMYFSTNAGDDPPVFQYVEGMGPPSEVCSSFSAFLVDSVQKHVSALPAMRATD